MTVALFWMTALLCVYGYFGYPALVWLLSRFINRAPLIPSEAQLPLRATILIAAHNEERSLGAKIHSLLTQDADPACFDILVVSDGSTDRTADIVNAFHNPRIRVLDLPRGGKAAALNAGVQASTAPVLVFSDADNVWQKDTLEKLLAPFRSRRVGAVSGRLDINRKTRRLGLGDRLYRNYEALVRNAETRLGSAVSADGGIFAIRREHWRELPGDVTDDFFISTCAILDGRALVFEPAAIAFDEGVESVENQYRRRVRVTVRGMRSLWHRRELMNPLRYGLYAWCLISHKLIRRLVPFFALLLLPLNLLVLEAGRFYQIAAVAQVAFYSIAALALLAPQLPLPRVARLCGFVVLSSLGIAVGVLRFLQGDRFAFWSPEQNR